MQLAKFALPSEFLFLFRIRFGLMSVLSRLGARANWYRLEKRYLEDFAKEENEKKSFQLNSFGMYDSLNE